jgi:hypothetical protein
LATAAIRQRLAGVGTRSLRLDSGPIVSASDSTSEETRT